MFRHLSIKDALRDAGWFVVAYVLAACFANSTHGSYLNALFEHASLLVFSLAAWLLLTFERDLFLARRAKTFRHVLSIGRALSRWMLLMVLLTILLRPAGLDPTELLAFNAAILLMFTARCLLHFSAWNLRWHGFDAIGVVLLDTNFAPLPFFPTKDNALFDANGNRGSPA